DKALDASKAGAVEDSNGFDFVVNTFVQPGEKRDVHALDVNTVDDAPDSSWFTNRIGRRTMSIEEIVRGPGSLPSISLGGWVVGAEERGRGARGLPREGSEGPDRPAVSDRIRSALESGNGERRRNHRHRLLSRVRLSHGRRLSRGTRPGEDHHRAR